MKVGLIYEKNDGVNESLFLSMTHMLEKLGIEYASVNYIDSIAINPVSHRFWNQFKHNIKLHGLGLKSYHFQTKRNLVLTLKGCDVVIKMNVMPDAFIVEKFDTISYIRNELGVPVLSYSNYFFGNRSIWPYWLVKMPGNFKGFDRYDFYLCSGDEPRFSLPKGIYHPYSVIGFNSQGLNLVANCKDEKLKVVVDFPQPGFEELRKFQLSILDEIECEVIVLNRKMSRENLYKIFESSQILFISSNESFGVSILEFQLAGGLIFTLPDFLPFHMLGDNKYGRNIITYDPKDRKKTINSLEANLMRFNSVSNRDNFIDDYPHYYYGNINELKDVLEKIERGEINVNSHLKYMGMEFIYAENTKDDVYQNFPELIVKLRKYDV